MREAFFSFLAAWPAPAQTVNESKPRRVLPVNSLTWTRQGPVPPGLAGQLEPFQVQKG